MIFWPGKIIFWFGTVFRTKNNKLSFSCHIYLYNELLQHLYEARKSVVGPTKRKLNDDGESTARDSKLFKSESNEKPMEANKSDDAKDRTEIKMEVKNEEESDHSDDTKIEERSETNVDEEKKVSSVSSFFGKLDFFCKG